MRIEVLYFAAAKDAAGCPKEMLELEPGTTAGQLLSAVSAKRPKLQKLVKQLRLAVNEEFAEADHALHEGDVVALIPPVAGG